MSLMESKASAAICVHLNVSVLQDGNCNSAGPRDGASSTSKKKATAAPPLTSKRMCSGLYILHVSCSGLNPTWVYMYMYIIQWSG